MTSRTMVRGLVLAALGGYADAVGYIRFEAFAGAMTGNTVLLAIDVGRGHWSQAMHHALILLTFFAGALGGAACGRSAWAFRLAVLLACGALVACDVFPGAWMALPLAFAMGAQNALARARYRLGINTVFVTGDLVRFAESLVGGGPKARAGRDLTGLAWPAYALGAGIGAFAQNAFAWPLAASAVVLALAFTGGPRSGSAAPERGGRSH